MLVLSLFFEGKEGSSPEEGHVIPGTEFPHLLLKFKNTHKKVELTGRPKRIQRAEPSELKSNDCFTATETEHGTLGFLEFYYLFMQDSVKITDAF